MPNAAKSALSYKGMPLRRCDNMIYYGRMADGYIVQMQILESEQVDGLDVPTRVNVQLQNTTQGIPAKDVVVRDASRTSLFDAIDVGEAWLTRQLTVNN
jgi:hypothetical protein